ncbi:MAG: hypothetical protein BroJett003_12920 [Planctomycetota bacterium]|nr:MAG: hypothetical protein BroJett003_12920 [Planctomycetota bacterium]
MCIIRHEIARRLRAGALLGQGKGVNEVARLVGASPSSVSRWKKALRRGPAGLAAKPHPEPKPRLNKAQKRSLVALLKRGTLAAGYPSDLRTCRRVADLIGRKLNVGYDPDHVWRIPHALGWSARKPEARARERDERAIERWRKRDWPRIKKGAAAERHPHVPRRIRLHAPAAGAALVGSARADAHHPLLGPARSAERHRDHHRAALA